MYVEIEQVEKKIGSANAIAGFIVARRMEKPLKGGKYQPTRENQKTAARPLFDCRLLNLLRPLKVSLSLLPEYF